MNLDPSKHPGQVRGSKGAPHFTEEEAEARQEGGATTRPAWAAPGFEPPARVDAGDPSLARAPTLSVALETAAHARARTPLFREHPCYFFCLVKPGAAGYGPRPGVWRGDPATSALRPGPRIPPPPGGLRASPRPRPRGGFPRAAPHPHPVPTPTPARLTCRPRLHGNAPTAEEKKASGPSGPPPAPTEKAGRPADASLLIFIFLRKEPASLWRICGIQHGGWSPRPPLPGALTPASRTSAEGGPPPRRRGRAGSADCACSPPEAALGVRSACSAAPHFELLLGRAWNTDRGIGSFPSSAGANLPTCQPILDPLGTEPPGWT